MQELLHCSSKYINSTEDTSNVGKVVLYGSSPECTATSASTTAATTTTTTTTTITIFLVIVVVVEPVTIKLLLCVCQLAKGCDADAIRLVDQYDWYIMPIINPDGYAYTFTDVSQLHCISIYPARSERSANVTVWLY